MTFIIYYLFLFICLKHESKCANANITIRRCIAIVYTLFLGLRGANVGVDTPIYYRHFYLFGQWGCDFVERGFDWINRFCYHQGWESWTLFLICAALTIIPVYLMLNKLGRKEYTIAALLFYGTTFITIANGMRQAVVCGVFLYLMSFYYDKNTFSKKEVAIYILGILASSLMHATSLFLLPLLLLTKIKIRKQLYVFIYLLSFVFVFIDISPYIPDISLGVRDYGRYSSGNALNSHASYLGFSINSVLKILIVYVMYKIDAFEKYRLLSHLVIIAFILSNIGFNIPIVGRVTMYFSWFVFILLAKMYSSYKLYELQFLNLQWLAITIIYLVLTVYSITSPANKVLPYTIYWQNNNYEMYIDDGL